MNRYDRVVVEMTKPSTSPKSVTMLPEPNAVIKTAAIIAIDATTPVMVFTNSGDRYSVGNYCNNAPADDRARHIALGIDHLFARAVLQFKPDPVENQQWDDSAEYQNPI